MTHTAWDETAPVDDHDEVDHLADDEPGTELAPISGAVLAEAPSIEDPLTTDQARELTDAIRSTSEALYVLLARAHAGKAWVALGYGSFGDYVRHEFDMSRSRAYQLLDMARVVAAIESAVPDGVPLPAISEAAARDLKSIIGDVLPEIEARTDGLAPDQAGEVVEEIVEDYRDRVREKREDAEFDRQEAEMDAAERGPYDGPSTGMFTPPPVDFDDDESDYDPALVRRQVQAAYDLYSALSALSSLSDVQAMVDIIPPERRVQINTQLGAAIDWLTQFAETWKVQPWQEDNSDYADIMAAVAEDEPEDYDVED